MNLRAAVLAEHSKTQTNKILKWVGSDQQRFDQLFDLFINDEPTITQRAGWPLSYAVIAHPELIQKHLGKLLKNLAKPNLHNAVKRNSIRLLQHISIPERFHGDVMNTCFDYITDPQEKPVVKVYSMIVLHKLSRQYPDIKNELKLVIQSQWENEKGAFRSRGKKILKEINS